MLQSFANKFVKVGVQGQRNKVLLHITRHTRTVLIGYLVTATGRHKDPKQPHVLVLPMGLVRNIEPFIRKPITVEVKGEASV